MPRLLLDTDILSEIIKQRDPVVAARAAEYHTAEGRFTTSVFSVMEVVYGFHRLGREDRIQQFLASIAAHEVLAFETPIAALAGRINGDLERRGTPVGLTDVMIAAVAIHHELPVVTGNTSHFLAVRDAGYALEVTNWRGATRG